jgi:hypothetical protein
MTKFWVAAALGAPIYYFERLLVHYVRRKHYKKFAVQRVDVD